MEDWLGWVDSLSVGSVVGDIPTGVYPVVVIGKAFGVNYSVWAPYFGEVWKGLGSVGD